MNEPNFMAAHPTVSKHFISTHTWHHHSDARWKVRGSPKSSGFTLWSTWISVRNLLVIQTVHVEILLSGPEWRRASRLSTPLSKKDTGEEIETEREKEKLDKVVLSQRLHLTLLTFFPWQEIFQSNQLDHSWDGNEWSMSPIQRKKCVKHDSEIMSLILFDETSQLWFYGGPTYSRMWPVPVYTSVHRQIRTIK